MREKTMSEEAKAIRREYARLWRAKNKDKVKAINLRYWEKKAREAAEAKQEAEQQEGGNNGETVN